MSEFGNTPFPRAPLIGAVVLLAVVVTGTAVTRLTGVGRSHLPDAPTVAQRELSFEDESDGSIKVVDAKQHVVIDVVAPGTNGFLRGTLRGLARERYREHIGPEEPFRLIERADGRLTLEDITTGRRVDLESFGPTNEAVFARLIGAQVTSGSTASTTSTEAPLATALASSHGATHE